MELQKFKDYLAVEKKYTQHTVIAYCKDVEEFVFFCKTEFGSSSIDACAYTSIRSWIVSLVNNSVTNRSINRKISSLKAYYKFLMKIGKIQTSPLVNHKALKTPKRVEVPFSVKEMDLAMQLLHERTDFEGVRDRLIVAMFYATGIRRSELIHIKVSDIDFSLATIKVLGKRNKERIIPLLPVLIKDLKQYLSVRKEVLTQDSEDFLFLVKSGTKIYENLVYRLINNYFSIASSKQKTSPHVLRHTFATHLLNNGADLNSVKELLGHSSLASTQVYTHNSIAELKKSYQNAHPRSNKAE
jgi:integrase/recombinase XerC